MGVIPPKPGYLQGLRDICDQFGALLLFDEVITGFRVAYGGAQELYGVTPDLTTLGKIIGGGLPVGAYGGKREIMEVVAPLGPVYQAGTLSGNPLAVSAGIATLKVLQTPGLYDDLQKKAGKLSKGILDVANQAGIPVRLNSVGSMSTLFFTETEVTDYGSAKTSDTDRYARYFREMRTRGIYLAPSQFEAAFVSTALADRDIDTTIAAAREAMGAL